MPARVGRIKEDSADEEGTTPYHDLSLLIDRRDVQGLWYYRYSDIGVELPGQDRTYIECD